MTNKFWTICLAVFLALIIGVFASYQNVKSCDGTVYGIQPTLLIGTFMIIPAWLGYQIAKNNE